MSNQTSEPRRARPAAAPGTQDIARLIRLHSSSVGMVLQRLGIPAGDVDDVRQRVWLTTARFLERLQPGRERAFLFAVARREAGHARRARRRRAEADGATLDSLESTAPAADDLVAQRDLLRRISEMIAPMTAQQQLLFLSLEGECPASEVARALGIPLGTAKSRLRWARQECQRLRSGAERSKPRR